jgi:phosphoribosylanthranilate isomerase
MFGKEVMKAVPVATRADIAATQAYAPVADRVLFDAKVPGDLPGGTGQQFDWRLLDALPAGMPWGLCGGLSPENVATAIRETGCDFVDVSSGVEDAPGVKSLARIAAFMAAVRTMQA